jgi:hypothetical protein
MDRKLWPRLESHPLSSAFIDAIENTHPFVPALSVKPGQTFLPGAKTDGRMPYIFRSLLLMLLLLGGMRG